MQYFCYNPITGLIEQTGQTTPELFELMSFDGLVMVEGTAQIGQQYVNGSVQDTVTREKLAADIADARWQYETGGTTWQGKPVNTEREAVASLGTMVDYGHSSGSWPEKWKLADGMFHVLRTDEYVSLRATVHAHVQQAFMWEDDELQRLANTPDSELVNFKVRIK